MEKATDSMIIINDTLIVLDYVTEVSISFNDYDEEIANYMTGNIYADNLHERIYASIKIKYLNSKKKVIKIFLGEFMKKFNIVVPKIEPIDGETLDDYTSVVESFKVYCKALFDRFVKELASHTNSNIRRLEVLPDDLLDAHYESEQSSEFYLKYFNINNV